MMHGGTVAARSKGVDTGSEFEVRLPLASAAAGATRAPDSVVEFRDRRILIVDMLLIALTGWGQEKDRRRSRGAGIDHHLVKPPDVSRLKELFTASAGPPRPPKLA